METPNRSIASFLLRFTQDMWRDAVGEPHLQWRGQIRHVQGDSEATFTDFAQAVDFIQDQLTNLTINSITGGNQMEQEKLMRESFKLWEQFASTYSNMMFDAMEKTIKQSEAIKEQMDEAVQKAMKGWEMPSFGGQNEVLQALEKLQSQIQALSDKVERLEKELKKAQ